LGWVSGGNIARIWSSTGERKLTTACMLLNQPVRQQVLGQEA
jgi:hypothetical protein